MSDHWYIQIEAEIYGPYTMNQMQGYLAERRILPSSMIAKDPAHVFRPLAETQEFAPKARPQQSVSVSTATSATPTAIQPEPGLDTQTYPPLRGSRSAAAAAAKQLEASVRQTPAAVRQIQPQEQAQPGRAVLLVMAEFRSGQAMAFLRELQARGSAQRIGDSVWLLQTTLTADALRNALSQTMTRQDRLFILDSFRNKTAWFNIGADMDKRIREMWDTHRQ